jgi:hypothetical protein
VAQQEAYDASGHIKKAAKRRSAVKYPGVILWLRVIVHVDCFDCVCMCASCTAAASTALLSQSKRAGFGIQGHSPAKRDQMA